MPSPFSVILFTGTRLRANFAPRYLREKERETKEKKRKEKKRKEKEQREERRGGGGKLFDHRIP